MNKKIIILLLSCCSLLQAGSWWDTLARSGNASHGPWHLPSVKESETVLDEWQDTFKARAVLIEQHIAELAGKIKSKLKDEKREQQTDPKKQFLTSNTAFQAELGSVSGSIFNFARELQMTLLNTNHVFGYHLMNIVAHQQAAGQNNKEPYDALLKLNTLLATGPLTEGEALNRDDINKIENYCTQLREIAYQLMNSTSRLIPHEARADAANIIGFYRQLLEQFNHTILQPLADYMPVRYVRDQRCVGRYVLFGAAGCATAAAAVIALYPHINGSPLPPDLKDVQAGLIITSGIAGAAAAPLLRGIKETIIPSRKSADLSWWRMLANKARGIKQIPWNLPAPAHSNEIIRKWEENFKKRSALIDASITVLSTQLRSQLQLTTAAHPFDATNTAMLAEFAAVTGSIINFARDLRMTILNVNHACGFHLSAILGKKDDTKTYQLLLKLDALLKTAPLAGKEAFNATYMQKIKTFTDELANMEKKLRERSRSAGVAATAVASMIGDYRTLLTHFNDAILTPLAPLLPRSNWWTWAKAATIGAGIGIAMIPIVAWSFSMLPTSERIPDVVLNSGIIGAAAGLGAGYKYATRGRVRAVEK